MSSSKDVTRSKMRAMYRPWCPHFRFSPFPFGWLDDAGSILGGGGSPSCSCRFEPEHYNYPVPLCISSPLAHKMKIILPNRILAACTVGTVGLGSKVRGSIKPAHCIVI